MEAKEVEKKLIGSVFVKVNLSLSSGKDLEGYLGEGLYEGDEQLLEEVGNSHILKQIAFGNFIIETTLGTNKPYIKVTKEIVKDMGEAATFESCAPIYVSVDDIESIQCLNVTVASL